MSKRSMLRRLPLSLFFLAVVALAAFVWHSTESLKDLVTDHMRDELHARCYLVENRMHTLGAAGAASKDVQALTRELAAGASGRITIIAPDGTVLGDSMEDPARMENHAGRPEIAAALRGERSWSKRFSPTLQVNMLYVARPIRSGGRITGVARLAVSLTAVDEFAAMLQRSIIIGGVVFACVSALLIAVSIRRITRPIAALREGAEQFARGNFAYRLPIGETDEVATLTDAMSLMARQLDERIRTILQQRNEQEAVLSSMAEGVIAIDTDERILNMNAAAGRLFDVDPRTAKGRAIQEVVRNIDVQRFAARTLEALEPAEGVITLRDGEDRHIQAHGSVLRDGDGRAIGAVIVTNDITQLRRLENVRRDFVANVSHELKTPVTSIKGFVETLQDGAAEDAATRDRFLAIIAKESDRLHNIIEDLLSLSRIEQESERMEVLLATTSVCDVVTSAVQSRAAIAAERSVHIDITCDPALRARANAQLLEQAVANLVDNAIKYSDTNTRVAVRAERSSEGVRIQVQDQGSGIPAEHLGRIFERFYRVDTSRSRASGSTGLGLSIVKHIVQAHAGTVSVESVPGAGSTFTIIVPPAV